MKTISKAVIYPICNGNYTDSNIEMIMSLRSIEKYLEGDFPVIVISEREPMYLSEEVLFVECSNYKDALVKACSLAEEFLWMNDDISLLKPHKWDDFRSMPRSGKQVSDELISKMLKEGSAWGKKKARVLSEMKKRGLTTYDYSSHSPYLYRSEFLIPIIEEIDFGYKTPYETAYGNVTEVPNRECKILSRHHDRPLPIDCSPYEIMNYADTSNLDHVRGFLLGKFPDKSRYEDYGKCNTTTLTMNQIK